MFLRVLGFMLNYERFLSWYAKHLLFHFGSSQTYQYSLGNVGLCDHMTGLISSQRRRLNFHSFRNERSLLKPALKYHPKADAAGVIFYFLRMESA